MKLELKHLAPYMPYGLRVHYSGLTDDDVSGEFNVIAYHAGSGVSLIDDSALKEGGLSKSFYVDYDFPIKPILRPISSITDIDVYNINNLIYDDVEVYFSLKDGLLVRAYGNDGWCRTPSLGIDGINKINEYLFKKHFDVFGLINKGLAIEKQIKL